MNTMNPVTTSFLKYEEDEFQYSRDDITVASGQNLAAGTVLGKITTGTISVGNVTFAGTGNGTCTKASPAYSATAQNGSYTAVCLEKTTDLGTFNVVRPDGTVDGVATVGVAYDGQVKFTIADGSTDFAAGDTFTIPVTASGTGKYAAFDPTATNGTATAAGVLLFAVNATSADTAGVAIVRHAVVAKEGLIWGAGVTTTGHKNAAYASLKALGVLSRTAI